MLAQRLRRWTNIEPALIKLKVWWLLGTPDWSHGDWSQTSNTTLFNQRQLVDLEINELRMKSVVKHAFVSTCSLLSFPF